MKYFQQKTISSNLSALKYSQRKQAWHVWADTFLENGCGHTEILLCVTEMHCKIKNGFYWFIYFHCQCLIAEKFEKVVFQAK